MASIQKSNYTVCEAFDIVGRRLCGDDWVGTEPKILRLRVVASTNDMQKEIEPSQHTPNLPTEELTLPLHLEANAQDQSQDEEQRAARQRCIDAEKKLRQIMSTRPVKSWMRDSERGVDEPLTQAQWNPTYDSFWINVSSGFCGDSRKGQEGGAGLIDCADFDAAIQVEFDMPWLANEAPKQAHPGFSENWVDAPEFTIEQVIWLWCNWEPGPNESYKERLKILPESEPIQRMLWSALWSKELSFLELRKPFPWDWLREEQKKATYYPHFVISRDALKQFATKKGHRPKFLFPEGTPDAARKMQSKGGSKSGKTVAALKMALQIIQDDDGIVGPLTNQKLMDWFENKNATKDKPLDIHGDFKRAYIEDRKTIIWNNREGELRKRTLDTIRRYYNDLKGR